VIDLAVIGGGPAGLMAAEVASRSGLNVALYDAMPSLGRKFLLAGVGGLNLTHSEPRAQFQKRYFERETALAPMLDQLDADGLRRWAEGLGVKTFVGSSGRVFPTEMKAAPLLRAWLTRLRRQGVAFHVRHRWLGWNAQDDLRFAAPSGETTLRPRSTVLALGGGSWARLGSDGAWIPWLRARGVEIAPLQPANCGFELNWSPPLRSRFAGAPVKSVRLSITDDSRVGEFIVTEHGIEGSLVYALSQPIRNALNTNGTVNIALDLKPDLSLENVRARLGAGGGNQSLSNHLRRTLGLSGVYAALLYEALGNADRRDMTLLAKTIKAARFQINRTRPLDEAISSAGGVAFEALDQQLMLRALPGVFCAGEMLDWEAPTGGYLLTACFASGQVAGAGAVGWLKDHQDVR
jgi:uncharacterized flavoprotein (TIGR03862 family)